MYSQSLSCQRRAQHHVNRTITFFRFLDLGLLALEAEEEGAAGLGAGPGVVPPAGEGVVGVEGGVCRPHQCQGWEWMGRYLRERGEEG